jgi:diacylglycerol kinase (ATP)
MRTGSSTVRRPAADALRAAEGTSAITANGAHADEQHVEPFDDVREPTLPPSPDMHAGYAAVNGSVAPLPRRRETPEVADGPDTQARPPGRQPVSTQHDNHAHEPLGPDDPLAPLPFNPYKGNRGITRAWHALKNSLAGFRVAIREESAFRQELTLAAILVPCGILVPVEPVARVLLLGSVLLVLIVELLNSSVEAAIDRISLERHELSRRAKDLGSAAVMVALAVCVMTWVLLVGPLLVQWVRAWF